MKDDHGFHHNNNETHHKNVRKENPYTSFHAHDFR